MTEKYKDLFEELLSREIYLRDDYTNPISIFSRFEKIILYGAGGGFEIFRSNVLQRFQLKAHSIFDIKFKTGEYYKGIPAFSPFNYQPSPEEQNNALVIITVV